MKGWIPYLVACIVAGAFASFVSHLAGIERVLLSWVFWSIDLPLVVLANWYFLSNRKEPETFNAPKFQLKDKNGDPL